MKKTDSSTEPTGAKSPLSAKELRRSSRDKVPKSVRIRSSDSNNDEEVRTTLNASRDGLYFTTWAEHYYVGMRINMTFPYASVDLPNSEYSGEIVRMERLMDGRVGIAVQIVLR